MNDLPAHTEPSGASNKARSGLLEDFKPALIPEALKPVGTVIPPLIGDHRELAEKLKSSKTT